MITALVANRIETASKLYKMRYELEELRSFIGFNEREVADINNAIHTLDALVNRIMKVGK